MMEFCRHCGMPLPGSRSCSCARSILATFDALKPDTSALEGVAKTTRDHMTEALPMIDRGILDAAKSLPSDYLSRVELTKIAGAMPEPRILDQLAGLQPQSNAWDEAVEAQARAALAAGEMAGGTLAEIARGARLFETIPDHYRQVFESLHEAAFMDYRQAFEPWHEAALIDPLAPFRSSFEEYAGLLAKDNALWRPLQESADLRFAMASLSSLRKAIDFGPFSDGTIAALRNQLGDWSAAPWIDPTLGAAERLDRYVELGLEPRLVQSPPTVFGKVLRVTGIFEGKPRASDRQYLLVPEPGEEDNGVDEEAMGDASRRFRACESRLRAFIDRILTTAHGAGWFGSRVPPDVLTNAKDRRKVRLAYSRVPNDSLLLFVDVGDLLKIIVRKDNWPLFTRHFGRKEAAQELFARLNPLRNDIYHSRTLSNADLLFFYAEILRIDQAIDRDAHEVLAEDDENDE